MPDVLDRTAARGRDLLRAGVAQREDVLHDELLARPSAAQLIRLVELAAQSQARREIARDVACGTARRSCRSSLRCSSCDRLIWPKFVRRDWS